MITSWKSLQLRTQVRLLVTGFVLCAWMAYRFAIAGTVELIAECAELQAQCDSSQVSADRFTALQLQLDEQEKLVSDTQLAITHEELLNVVSVYCDENDLKILSYAEPLTYLNNEWKVETHTITVKGNYTGILQLVEYLYRNRHGILVSLDLQSRTDNKTKVRSLQATLYIQNILSQRA